MYSYLYLYMPASSSKAMHISFHAPPSSILRLFFPSFPAFPPVPRSRTTPLPIRTIVPRLSRTGQTTQMTIRHHTHIKLTTHQPVKFAREQIHPAPNRVNGTSRIATIKKRMLKVMLKATARRVAQGHSGGSSQGLAVSRLRRRGCTIDPVRSGNRKPHPCSRTLPGNSRLSSNRC